MPWTQNYDPLAPGRSPRWSRPCRCSRSSSCSWCCGPGSGSRRWAGCWWPSAWRSPSSACPRRSSAAACRRLGPVRRPARIAWIIVASIFLYDVAVETGQFQVMKESIARAVVGQAAAADPDRLLLRRVPGGHRRRRGAGGDRRLVPDRPGFDPFQAATLCLRRQHGAGRLGRRRQPDPRPGGRDRPARARPSAP